jgi:hypothetical protein
MQKVVSQRMTSDLHHGERFLENIDAKVKEEKNKK